MSKKKAVRRDGAFLVWEEAINCTIDGYDENISQLEEVIKSNERLIKLQEKSVQNHKRLKAEMVKHLKQAGGKRK